MKTFLFLCISILKIGLFLGSVILRIDAYLQRGGGQLGGKSGDHRLGR